jgi:hypothetical protein
MDIYDEEMVNVDKNSIIKYLCQRDLLKNYFPKDQIIKYLKDLNYYSIDTDKELKKYLINNLCKIISDKLEYDFYSNINEKNIAEILEEIKSSNDY